LAPTAAALVNGTAGHALDYDDIGLGAGHISVSILPAAFAVAELVEASGEDLVDAVILGYEIAHRLTTMYGDTRLGPYAAGYHKPSVYSTFGATAAAGRLLGLDAAQLAHAFGIAASEAGGLRVNFGTMTKPFHAGLSNRTGVEAALLAQRGFTASAAAMEGRFGWHDVICRREGDLEVVTRDLGAPFAVEEGMVFKGYPCCGANHYAIDGIIALLRDHGLRSSDVASVDVDIESRSLTEVLVYPWPTSALEGKFSLAYNVAAAVEDGAVTVETFTDGALTRLSPWRDRIRVHPRDDLPALAADVTIRTTDGRTLVREHGPLHGSLDDPMSWDDLVVKFEANALGPLGRANVDAVIDLVAKLGPAVPVRDLTEHLQATPVLA
jgi:2-methylcitrate dehydratase PrpD